MLEQREPIKRKFGGFFYFPCSYMEVIDMTNKIDWDTEIEKIFSKTTKELRSEKRRSSTGKT